MQTMGEEVKLHGIWSSPFTLRVICALKLKGIAYEYLEEERYNKSALFLQYNPIRKRTPVLVHAGKSICESMIILENMEEMWPTTPLLRTDPYDRTIAHFWIKFAEDKGEDIMWKIFLATGKELEVVIKESLKTLETVEEHAFNFNGEKIGMVDIAFGSVIYCISVTEDMIRVKLIESHKFPRLHEWYQNFLQVPVIKENLPDHDKMICGENNDLPSF